MPDPPTIRTAKVSADLARALSGYDANIVPSIATSLSGGLDKINVQNLETLRASAQAIGAVRPIVAPQIAEVLASMNSIATSPTYAGVLKTAELAAFNFSKVLADVEIPKLTGRQWAETIKTLQLSADTRSQLAAAVASMPSRPVAVTAARVSEAVADAVAIAEVEDVAEVVDASVGRFESMSARERRAFALDVAVLIAALVMLSATLRAGDAANVKAAGAALAAAVQLVRVYWRLTDKL
jgi:hypothetical protein